MRLIKKIQLKECGKNYLKEERHTVDGKYIKTFVSRKDEESWISVNEVLIKAIVYKKEGLWKLYVLEERKEYKRRIDAETEAVRMIIEKIYEVLFNLRKDFEFLKWEEGKEGLTKNYEDKKIELKEEKEKGKIIGYILFVDGEQKSEVINRKDKGKKKADNILIWNIVYEKIGMIGEEWEREELINKGKK